MRHCDSFVAHGSFWVVFVHEDNPVTRLSGMTTAQIDAGLERIQERQLCRYEAEQDRADREHEALCDQWGGDLELADYFDSIIDNREDRP